VSKTRRAKAERAKSVPRKALSAGLMTLEELERRVRAINELLGAIDIRVEIDRALRSLDYETRRRIDEYELYELERYLLYDVPDDVKESIVRAVLAEHYIDPATVDYEKVGFEGWEHDECAHYAFVKLADGRYAIVYSCGDEIEYLPSEQ
jgi:hypothetical protein